MTTHQTVAERTGTTIPPHLIDQADVPVATNGWRQGDVYVIRHNAGPKGEGIALTGAGHKVVAGEADRNSHIFNGDGRFYPGQYRSDYDYGLLVVPQPTEDCPEPLAVLTHTDEHGSIGFGPGSWLVRSQVSHETELRRAAD